LSLCDELADFFPELLSEERRAATALFAIGDFAEVLNGRLLNEIAMTPANP
jgi:UDP-2,3-diacylglucosamine pyrophosphatase LpxH